MRSVRIAAAQTPEFRGDVAAALNCVTEFVARAAAEGAALLCFPECFLQGYLREDAEARKWAFDLATPEFAALLEKFPRSGPTIVVGTIELDGGRLFNTAVFVSRGQLLGRYRKAHLLRGERVFDGGCESPIFTVADLRFGINICYDTNFPEASRKVAERGGELIVCPANNMLPRKTAELLKDEHVAVRGARCRETGLWLVSADVTGCREGCVSYGPTAVLDASGAVVAQLPLGQPGLLIYDLPCRD